MRTTAILTSEGLFAACYSERGLAGLEFPTVRGGARRTVADDETSWPAEVRRWHRLTTTALRRALAGKAPGEMPPFDLSDGTEFQQHIWRELRRIAPGQTKSYAQIAAAIGRPAATRAAGGACGANPIPVLVPCHRVLAAHGGLGGFSGGLEWKRRLLEREGVAVTSSANSPSRSGRRTSPPPSRLR